MVRADRTGVEPCAQTWCLRRRGWPAELELNLSSTAHCQHLPDEAEGAHAYRLEVDIAGSDFEDRSEDG